MPYRYKFPDGDWVEVVADEYEQIDGATACSGVASFRISTSHTIVYACGKYDFNLGRYKYTEVGTGVANLEFRYNVTNSGDSLIDVYLEYSINNHRDLGQVATIYRVFGVDQHGVSKEAIRTSSGGFTDVGSPSHPGCDTGDRYSSPIDANTIKISRISPWDNTEIDCNQCTVNFFLDGKLIETISGNSCPEIEEIPDEKNECPPDTCEVDCHTHICCYDSNGIAVHSFDKP